MEEREETEVEELEDLDVPKEDAEEIGGGRAPSPPSGPQPTPYPNP